MKRARDCQLFADYERHHIKPRCLGGTNDKKNIVRLTYREHFLAHWLLTKMTSGVAKQKMHLALARMCHRSGRQTRIIAGWQYALARKANSTGLMGNKHLLGKRFSKKTRRRMSEVKKGKKFSVSHRKKLSSAKMGNKYSLGHKHSATTRKKIADWHTGRVLSKETKLKIGLANSCIIVSEETRAKMRSSQKRRRKREQQI